VVVSNCENIPKVAGDVSAGISNVTLCCWPWPWWSSPWPWWSSPC